MIFVERNVQFLHSFFLASLASLFWLYFWYHYSKKYTTPHSFLLKAFLLGGSVGVIAWLLEKKIFLGILPGEVLSLLEKEKSFADFGEILFVFGAVFFLTALPEEILKFLCLKFFLFKSKKFNQIIDGIKFGIVLGLGFALVENTVVFSVQLERGSIFWSHFFYLFLFRFFITTLTHSLYGGMLGYYFGLAKFYKIFQNTFLWQGFWSTVLFHSFFNFLVLTPLNLLTFLVLTSTLVLLLKWYTDRKNFQFALSSRLPSKVKTPIFAEPREIQALIAEGTNSDFRLAEKLGLCPFCFKKIDPEKERCSYCGAKLNLSNMKKAPNNK